MQVFQLQKALSKIIPNLVELAEYLRLRKQATYNSELQGNIIV